MQDNDAIKVHHYHMTKALRDKFTEIVYQCEPSAGRRRV